MSARITKKLMPNIRLPDVPELALLMNDCSCNTGTENVMDHTQFIDFRQASSRLIREVNY